MELLICFAFGFLFAWTVRTAEWKRGKWFIWVPRAFFSSMDKKRRTIAWGFWYF